MGARGGGRKGERREGVNGDSGSQAMRSQKMKMMPTQRKTLDKNCSSTACGDPGAAETGATQDQHQLGLGQTHK